MATTVQLTTKRGPTIYPYVVEMAEEPTPKAVRFPSIVVDEDDKRTQNSILEVAVKGQFAEVRSSTVRKTKRKKELTQHKKSIRTACYRHSYRYHGAVSRSNQTSRACAVESLRLRQPANPCVRDSFTAADEMGDILNKYKAAEEEQKQKYEVPMQITEERIEEATRVWALNNERLYHHRKERLYHLPHIQQELDARREELIDSFSKQNVLLIGPPGAGKSSIINSFNYVVSLAADKDALFEEIAEVGGNTEETKTRHLLHYDATVGGMYKALLESPNDKHRKKAQVAPTLLDTPGLPDRSDLKYLLQALVLGDIPIESDLEFCMSFKANNYKHFMKSVSEKKVEAKAACAVLLVIQNSSLKKKAEWPFPSELVDALSNVLFQTPGTKRLLANL